MSPQDQMLLRAELNALNNRIAACSGVVQAAKGSAAAPPFVPPTGGPVLIPALTLICESLQLQQDALTSTARLIEKIIDRA